MTAADRISALDQMPASQLCSRADEALTALVKIMNEETTLLRAGRLKEAGTLTADKTSLSQEYVTLARAVQREGARLNAEVPEMLAQLKHRHESLATQMAENLRVLATAKTVAEDILSDVAAAVSKTEKPQTYGAAGQLGTTPPTAARGLSVNRAL